MNPLSTSEKKKILSRPFWDIENIPADIESFLEDKFRNIEDTQSQQFFSKLLASCDWYTLLKLIPKDKLETVLDDRIIGKLFPLELKRKYTYARNVLSRNAISISR